MYCLLQEFLVEPPRVQNPYKGMTDKIEKTYHLSYDTAAIVAKGSFVFFTIAIQNSYTTWTHWLYIMIYIVNLIISEET